MTWPDVMKKLAEIELDECGPKLKEQGYDSMDAFDPSDTEALKEIADMLNLKPGHKAKFVKKFSEAPPPHVPAQPATIGVQSANPVAAQPATIGVQSANPVAAQPATIGNGSTMNFHGKIPATWLIGKWDGNHEKGIISSDPFEITAVDDDKFDMSVSNKLVGSYIRSGNSNNFNAAYTQGTNDCCGYCGNGVSLSKPMLQSMIITDENLLQGGAQVLRGADSAVVLPLLILAILFSSIGGFLILVPFLWYTCCSVPVWALKKISPTDFKRQLV